MSTNGSSNGTGGNGHDPGDKDDKKIVSFPTLAERDRMRREERKEEERWRKEYRKKAKAARKASAEPFFNFGNIPPLAAALISSFIIIQILVSLFLNDGQKLELFYTFGFIPGMYTGTFEWHWLGLITPITHAFLHGSWVHLTFNAVMGLALIMFLERILAPRRTAIFFILCTISGALFYLFLAPFTTAPIVGASGGTSGLFGALIYTTIMQNNNHPLALSFSKRGPWPVLIFWGAMMVLPGLLMGGAIAWQAHLGGYVCGVGLMILLQKGKITL